MKNYAYIINGNKDINNLMHKLFDKIIDKLAIIKEEGKSGVPRIKVINGSKVHEYISPVQMERMKYVPFSKYEEEQSYKETARQISEDPCFRGLDSLLKDEMFPIIFLIVVKFDKPHVNHMKRVYENIYKTESMVLKLDGITGKKSFEPFWNRIMDKYCELMIADFGHDCGIDVNHLLGVEDEQT